MIEIVEEPPEDRDAIEALLDRAFGADRRRKASYRFRTAILPIPGLSLVAKEDGAVVGTIRYWPIMIGETRALLLGPVAVDPTRRCSGLGGDLIRRSLRMAQSQGHRLVILVGDCAFYSRFGFDLASTLGISMPAEDPARVQCLDLDSHPEYALPGAPAAALTLGDGIIRRNETAAVQSTYDCSRRIYAAA